VRGKPRRPVLGILLDAAGEWQEFFLGGAGAWVCHPSQKRGTGRLESCWIQDAKSKCRSTHAFAAANALAQDNKSYGVMIWPFRFRESGLNWERRSGVVMQPLDFEPRGFDLSDIITSNALTVSVWFGIRPRQRPVDAQI